MNPPKAGTNKRAVYDHFVQHGLVAAERFAPSVRVQPSTVRRWAKEWQSPPAVAHKQERKMHSRGTPVTVLWDKDTPAYIVQQGEQISEVKFADGRVRMITNEQLKTSVAKRSP